MIDSRLTENCLNPQKVYSQQYVDELKAKYDWHTGTPTEDGLYVIAFRFGNKIEHEIREMFYSPDYGMTFGIKKDIVAWQKIEPYEDSKGEE